MTERSSEVVVGRSVVVVLVVVDVGFLSTSMKCLNDRVSAVYGHGILEGEVQLLVPELSREKCGLCLNDRVSAVYGHGILEGEVQLLVPELSREKCKSAFTRSRGGPPIGDEICLSPGVHSVADIIPLHDQFSFGNDYALKVKCHLSFNQFYMYITKQRKRWTDEEHKKFLEALKLYGRA
ncbi:hypothetical protein V8G54_023286 [Vigna mungo]|uniref:Uncharacterized protein n=1 Tax=Vigna mungo TaxID=3915 RepID=A0AAQ3N4H2_VIGMU